MNREKGNSSFEMPQDNETPTPVPKPTPDEIETKPFGKKTTMALVQGEEDISEEYEAFAHHR